MTEAETPRHCRSCDAPAPDAAPFCESCGAVRPPGPADHFARLGAVRAFDIDTAALERRYFALQRALHPDRFASRPERERALSMRWSMALNEAWGVLGDPLRRAEYLLALQGVTVNAETGSRPADADVLAEAMADREAAMEADDPAAVDRLADAAKARRAACEGELAASFSSGDADSAARLATRLKYLVKFAAELRARRKLVAGSA